MLNFGILALFYGNTTWQEGFFFFFFGPYIARVQPFCLSKKKLNQDYAITSTPPLPSNSSKNKVYIHMLSEIIHLNINLTFPRINDQNAPRTLKKNYKWTYNPLILK